MAVTLHFEGAVLGAKAKMDACCCAALQHFRNARVPRLHSRLEGCTGTYCTPAAAWHVIWGLGLIPLRVPAKKEQTMGVYRGWGKSERTSRPLGSG